MVPFVMTRNDRREKNLTKSYKKKWIFHQLRERTKASIALIRVTNTWNDIYIYTEQ